MDKQIRDIPVRLRMVSRRYAVAASLFETVFRRIAGMSDKQKLQAWNRARNIATTTLKAIKG